MDTISLYYFTEAAKDLNFTQTANRLFLSQQNLSSHIARLESKCGCKLFQRKPKVQLTYEGELFLAYAKEAVASESNILSVLKAVADEDSGRLHIGISTPRAAIFIPEILRDFTKTYPGVSVRISDRPSYLQERQLADNAMDFCVGVFQSQNPELQATPSADRRPVPVHVGRPAPDVCSGPGRRTCSTPDRMGLPWRSFPDCRWPSPRTEFLCPG